MERLKSITIIFLLAMGLLNSIAPPICFANRSSGTKPASVLLQEGLYAEQIDGDLDAAIRIYEQVIAAAKETQRAAAQATYRIGMCYLKKGEKGKATEQFRKLIVKFPEHESILKETQKQLAKLKPVGVKNFGPVVERIIYTDETGKDCFFDLDKGKAFSIPQGLTRSSEPEKGIPWILENGIDFVNCVGRLQLWDMVAVEVEEKMWDSAGAVEINSILMRGPSKEELPTWREEYTVTTPFTYAFKTREGGIGILQILEKKDNNLRIRYKMLQERAKTVAVGWRKVFLPDADTPGVNAILDLASGELLPAGEGVQQLTVFREMGKGDLAYDRVLICLRGGKAKLLQAGKLTNLKIKGQIEDSTAYELPSLPCSLVVTTSEGDNYEVAVTSADNSGANLEYKKMLAEPAEVASVASFGPAKVARLYDIDHPTTTEKECAIDFDTGKLSKIPPQARQMPGDDLMRWLSGSGIDAVAEIAGKNGGLIGIDVAVKTMPPYVWDKISPTELRALMVNNNSARQETTPMLLEDEDQQVFAFRTRDSGLGILQILDVDKSKQMVQFRYKMLQKESAGRIVFLPDADDVIQQGKVAVVLDLTTGKMLPGNKDKQYFNKLNKGDVAYFDDEGKDLLVCFRGAKITRKTANGKYYDTPDQSHTDNTVHIYIIKKTPAEWTITTKEGDIYELKVLSLDNDQAKIKYRKMFRYKMLQGETAQLSVSSHKVFLPECDTTVYDLLDLASSRIINSEPGGEVLDLSKPDGKGNLYFDKAKGQLWLVGVRGTRMRLRSGGELLSSEPDFISRGRNAYYLLGEIPCKYQVTTTQGDNYELKVLSMDAGDRPGVHIEYWKSAESPGAFDVATPVRGDAAKAMELLSGLKALMAGVVGAVESDDPNTALLLLDKLIAQSKQFKSTVKDTSVEAAVKAGLELLDPLRDALEKKQMDRVKSLLAALNQMGPAVESALEKEAEQQGQSKKRTGIDEKLRSAFIACGTLCDSIRNALDDDDFETAEALCKEVEKHLAKGLELTPQSELGPMLESLAVQFKIWHEAIKAKDKEKAIRLGEALNHAGGLISDFVLEEKPDTHK